MRPNRLRSIIGWTILVGQPWLVSTAWGADDANAPPKDDRMAAIVAAVRAEEAKYREVEYAIKVTRTKVDPRAPDGPGEVTSLARRSVVFQGDRLFLRDESFGRTFGTKSRDRITSAYDGETTRTVIEGSCVNIHAGRFEHPEIYSVHCLPLIHYRVNFPLSVYLSGTEAIHADPRYPRFDHETGSAIEFTKVAARFEGEEKVDGLRCLKVRVDRWHYSKDVPAQQNLWLAPERNYLCIKEQLSWPRSRFGDRLFHEMRVGEMREVAPGTWFPSRITVRDFNAEAPQEKRPVVSAITETIVEEVTLSPKHDLAFFRDISIPAGLPIFEIKGRTLVGSSLPEPVGGEREQAKLDEIVARLREQEARYANCEVRAREGYKSYTSQIDIGGAITEKTAEDHSILLGNRGYFTSRRVQTTLRGGGSEALDVHASDGAWLRTLRKSARPAAEPYVGASLQRVGSRRPEGRQEGIPVYRPHTLMQRYDWIYGPLADLIVSPWYDRTNQYRLRFRYCGEAKVKGHPCLRLRGDVSDPEGGRPLSSFVLFLATDRNLIPIRLDHYGGNFGYLAMPSGVSTCEDLREVAPGTWYPFRITELAFDGWLPMAQGRIVLNWRRDITIESVDLAPKVDEDLFQGPAVPEGTRVQVLDDERNHLGEFEQPQDGPASITPEAYEALRSRAREKAKKSE